jgi:hypothetical protein
MFFEEPGFSVSKIGYRADSAPEKRKQTSFQKTGSPKGGKVF